MLTPSYLLHAVEPAEEIAEQLHKDIVDRIIERIHIRFQRGDSYILTPLDKWQLETLQQAGFLLEDIQKEIAAATGLMEQELVEAFEDAGVTALEYDDAIYREAGMDPVPLVQSPYMIQLMQRDYEATLGEWKNFTNISKRAIHSLFVNVCDTAFHQAASGMISPSQAVREALEEVIAGGVYVNYTDKNGNVIRRDTIETATARAVRTGISQSSAKIQIARMNEFGVDLVIVSSHLGARPDHQVWQGKIYSISGGGEYPDFIASTGYGSVTGLCGANCRHHFSPWFEGQGNPFEQFDAEENLKRYELEQQQRTMERRIRNTKRQVMNLKTEVDKEKDPDRKAEFELEYQRKSALLQRQNKAYNQFCDENGMKKQHERIHIAKWGRSQAAKARAAAKKYAEEHPDYVEPKEYKPRKKKIVEKMTMQERMLKQNFKPATTVQEAEGYTERFVEKYKSKYSGNVSFKGMDVEHANKVNRILTAVYDAYDIPVHTDITVMNFRESKWKTAVDDGIAAAYQWGGNGGRLFINQKLIGTKKTADTFKKKGDDLLKTVLDGADILLNKPGIRPTQKKYIEALIKSGRQVTAQSCDDFVEATIVHEMGHSLDSKLFRKYFRTSSNMDGLDIGISMEKYADGVSGYAVSTKEEYIAESFALWWYGMTEPLDPDLIKIFEGAMKK